MNEQESLPAQLDGSLRRIDPLPARIYHSNGIIFELYDGGQHYHPMIGRWERLEFIEGVKSLPELCRGVEEHT